MYNVYACKTYQVEYGYEASYDFTEEIIDIFRNYLDSGFVREYDEGYDLECDDQELKDYIDGMAEGEFKKEMTLLYASADKRDSTLHFVVY